MGLASKPWMKLGLLCLLIILFMTFKIFNKKAEGFITCPEGTYSNETGSCITCPIPIGVNTMTSPAGSTSQEQCVAHNCSGGYYLHWQDGTCRPEWGAGAGFSEDDFEKTIFRRPQNFKIDSSNMYIGTTDISGNDISNLVSDKLKRMSDSVKNNETIMTVITYLDNKYNYSYIRVNSVDTNLFPSDSILSTPYYKLSIYFIDQSDPLPTASINNTVANVKISWRYFTEGCAMTPWSTHNTCIPLTSDGTGTREGTITNKRIIIKSFDHTDTSICDRALEYARTRSEPCNFSGPYPAPNCPAGQRLNGSSCEACPSGTYQDQADFTGNTCKAIPPTNVARSSSSSVTCETGYTLNSEGTRCEPIPCTAGTNYNIETGLSPCTSCPPNSECTTRGFTCLPNYILAGNTCISEICDIGTYSSTGIYPCTPCSNDYTTTITGAKNETDCKRTLSVQDILKQLNYSPTNTSGKFYGLTAANINVSTDQTIIQGEPIDYTTYITPLSLVEQSETNYNNQTSFNLTFPNGRAVNKEGIFPAIIQNLPPSTSGSIKNINDAANCSGFTADTCTISYNTPSGGDKITTNPCPALNAWYDFDKGFCVNKNGSRVSTPFICPAGSIYNKETNACISIRPPFFKNQPLKTIGTPNSGDITNCLTVDGGDCQPLYKVGTTTTTRNPCTGTTVYDFGRRSCTNSVRQTHNSTCCSMGAEAASRSQPCLPFINTVPVKNTTKCRTRPNICCNSQAYSTNKSCINNEYWQMQKSFKPGACAIAGFSDMAEDTMQTKRIKWAEKRQLLNVP